jgi:pyruvate,orthophosphate dikinase
VRSETSPEDVPAMAKAAGVLTCRGGLASHAAVVARGWGIPAVVGAAEVSIDGDAVMVAGRRFAAGDVLSLDGATGEVFAGEVPGHEEVAPEAATLLAWAAELGIDVPTPAEEGAEAPAAAAPATEVADDDVLGWLHLKTISAPEALAACLLTTEEVLQPVVERLTEQGLLGRAAGALLLTEIGTARAEELARTDRERWGAERAEAALDAFLPLDQRMKTTVTAWQMRDEQTVNDHSDEAYDAAVLADLRALHADAAGWLGSLGDAVPRFGQYLARFGRAIAAVDAGDARFVASPRVDSYHSVWFELHEDLIRLAGRTREDEVAAGRA